VADFTYIWTAEGWLYVAAVIDLFSRQVVGWSMQAAMTAQPGCQQGSESLDFTSSHKSWGDRRPGGM